MFHFPTKAAKKWKTKLLHSPHNISNNIIFFSSISHWLRLCLGNFFEAPPFPQIFFKSYYYFISFTFFEGGGGGYAGFPKKRFSSRGSQRSRPRCSTAAPGSFKTLGGTAGIRTNDLAAVTPALYRKEPRLLLAILFSLFFLDIFLPKFSYCLLLPLPPPPAGAPPSSAEPNRASRFGSSSPGPGNGQKQNTLIGKTPNVRKIFFLKSKVCSEL